MPTCPHCKNKIVSDQDVKMKRLNSAHSVEVDVIYCAYCDSILGVD